MSPKKKGIFQIIISIILFLISWWALLWVLSSGSLSGAICGTDYSLFHEKVACRQPYIAIPLWLISGILSIVFFYKGIKNTKEKNENT